MTYITGKTIRDLRERQQLTQKELASQLHISDKTISKWENNRGLPDIGILQDLANALHVSLVELMQGEWMENTNSSSNMKKISFYVCPICGNIIQAVGPGVYSCCGISLPPLEIEEMNDDHNIYMEEIDGEYVISMNHEMSKQHYISFLAYVSGNRIDLVKLYPEGDIQCHFQIHDHGFLYGYCNRHGLFCKTI